MLKNYIEGKRVFHEEKINVQSRYYNHELGRFLDVDAIGGNVGYLLIVIIILLYQKILMVLDLCILKVKKQLQ